MPITKPAGQLARNAVSEEPQRQRAPAKVTTEFKRIWKQLVNDFPPEYFRDSDREAMISYCEITIRLRQVRKEMATAQFTCFAPDGKPFINPLLTAERMLAKDQLMVGRSLRLTPSARIEQNQVPAADKADGKRPQPKRRGISLVT